MLCYFLSLEKAPKATKLLLLGGKNKTEKLFYSSRSSYRTFVWPQQSESSKNH